MHAGERRREPVHTENIEVHVCARVLVHMFTLSYDSEQTGEKSQKPPRTDEEINAQGAILFSSVSSHLVLLFFQAALFTAHS